MLLCYCHKLLKGPFINYDLGVGKLEGVIIFGVFL